MRSMKDQEMASDSDMLDLRPATYDEFIASPQKRLCFAPHHLLEGTSTACAKLLPLFDSQVIWICTCLSLCTQSSCFSRNSLTTTSKVLRHFNLRNFTSSLATRPDWRSASNRYVKFSPHFSCQVRRGDRPACEVSPNTFFSSALTPLSISPQAYSSSTCNPDPNYCATPFQPHD